MGGYDVNGVECPINRASDSLVVETDTVLIEEFLIEFYDDLAIVVVSEVLGLLSEDNERYYRDRLILVEQYPELESVLKKLTLRRM